jgi:hypothetical protein
LGERLSASVKSGVGIHPASYIIATGSFPGVKRLERGVKHPQPSNVEYKERVEIHFYSPSFSSWQVIG